MVVAEGELLVDHPDADSICQRRHRHQPALGIPLVPPQAVTDQIARLVVLEPLLKTQIVADRVLVSALPPATAADTVRSAFATAVVFGSIAVAPRNGPAGPRCPRSRSVRSQTPPRSHSPCRPPTPRCAACSGTG
jgi:hypothetical protein